MQIPPSVASRGIKLQAYTHFSGYSPSVAGLGFRLEVETDRKTSNRGSPCGSERFSLSSRDRKTASRSSAFALSRAGRLGMTFRRLQEEELTPYLSCNRQERIVEPTAVRLRTEGSARPSWLYRLSLSTVMLGFVLGMLPKCLNAQEFRASIITPCGRRRAPP